MELHSYGKVHAFGHRYNKGILASEVSIQEKIDGSQFSFGLVDGELVARSRSKAIDFDAPEKMFIPAVEAILARKDKLRPGYTYRGEFLGKPKHNALAYSRVPVDNIIIFDIETEPLVFISDYDRLIYEADRIDFETVPMLYKGLVSSLDEILELLEKTPFLGGPMLEGVVIKNYSIPTEMGTLCMAKVVREDFKEKLNKEWKKSNPTKHDVIENLTAMYKTEARWEKAIQHLKERGELTETPKDIGPLLKEIMTDIKEEEEEAIKEVLFSWAWKQLNRTIIAGFPEWYKQRLVEKLFEGE